MILFNNSVSLIRKMAELKLITAHFIHTKKIQYTSETLTQDCIDLVEYFDCNNVVKKAIVEGLSLDNIKYLIKVYKFDDWNHSIECAAEGGRRELVEFFNSKGAWDWNRAMAIAAKSGHRELVDFIISKNAWYYNNWAMIEAVEGGHSDLVEFFISKGADNWNYGMYAAAKDGNRELVEFFISKGANNWNWGMNFAARGGHRELVEFFISKGAII